jgi:dienelactone hydrolase
MKIRAIGLLASTCAIGLVASTCAIGLVASTLGSVLLAASAPPPSPTAGAPPAAPPAAEETWRGTLEVSGTPLRLVLHLTHTAGGALTASIDSVDQGAYGIAVAAATLQNATLRLALPAIGASYEGRVAPDGRTIDGTWAQGAGSLPLVLVRQDAGAAASPPATGSSPVAGIWQGTLSAGAGRLRLQLHVAVGEGGELTCRLDSLDQGANGLACSDVKLAKLDFHFAIPVVAGTYDGKLAAAGDEIQGTWTQGGRPLPLSFRRGGQPEALRRPQNPTPPYPYQEQQVTYPNAGAGVVLAGTLTLPPGPGPFPAVLLIAGSGAQGRDETVAGHAIFLVLADHLTRQGIAVLRSDKRGVGKSTGSYAEATTADFAADAEAGVAYLRTRREIDGRKIGLVGHSEGAIIAPMVASRSAVAWIVCLAGDAMKGEDLLLLQRRLIDQAAGLGAAEMAKNEDLQRQSFAIVHQQRDAAAAEKKLAELYAHQPAARDLPAATREASIRFVNSPWMRFFLDYDPVPAWRQTRCPVLALYGAKDLQVPPQPNLPILQKIASESGNRDFRVEEFSGLNHLFQHAASGSPNEYTAIEETMSPEVLAAIATWILQHAAAVPGAP